MIDLDDPTALLLLVSRALRDAGIDHALYGGLALAVYGEPRETRDADVAVAGLDIEAAMASLSHAGIAVIKSFERVQFGGNFVTRLALVGGEQLNTADFVEPVAERFARLALSRALSGQLRGETVRVVTPEDFVLFKLMSTRERDTEDARTVCRLLGAALSGTYLETQAALLDEEVRNLGVQAKLAIVRDA